MGGAYRAESGGLAPTLRLLPPAESRPLLQRLDAIEGRGAPPVGALGSSPVSNAILAYLAAQTAETVTTAAVEEHLAAAGLTTLRAHAATTLGRFMRHGIVARVRRGVYRINRFHPELLAMRQGAEPAPSATPAPSVIPAEAGISGNGEGFPPSRE